MTMALRLIYAAIITLCVSGRFSSHSGKLSGPGLSTDSLESTKFISSIQDIHSLVKTSEESKLRIHLKKSTITKDDTNSILSLMTKSLVKDISMKNCVFEDGHSLANVVSSVVNDGSNIISFSICNCCLDADALMPSCSQRERSHNQNLSLTASPIIPPQLQLLDVSCSKLDTRAFRYLAYIMNRCPKLSCLVMDSNRITLEETRTIVHSLRRHPSIRYVSLSHCGLTDDCMEFIGFCIKCNRNITALDLSLNSISSAGFHKLVDAFRVGAGKYLTYLDLSYNTIGDIGIVNIARAFESNQLPNLKHLILREVGAGHVALERLLMAIPEDSLLESLDISGNALLPSSKTKEKTLKYSPKNLKKLIEKQVTPHLTNAVNSVSGALNTHLQTVTDMFNSNKEALLGYTSRKPKKNYKPKLIKGPAKSRVGQLTKTEDEDFKDDDCNNDSGVRPHGKPKVCQGVGSKKKKNGEGNDSKEGPPRSGTVVRGQTKGKIARKVIPRIAKDRNICQANKGKLSTGTVEERKAERDAEKIRVRAMKALLRTAGNARRLRFLGLAKVGLNKRACEIAKKVVVKMSTQSSLSAAAAATAVAGMRLKDSPALKSSTSSSVQQDLASSAATVATTPDKNIGSSRDSGYSAEEVSSAAGMRTVVSQEEDLKHVDTSGALPSSPSSLVNTLKDYATLPVVSVPVSKAVDKLEKIRQELSATENVDATKDNLAGQVKIKAPKGVDSEADLEVMLYLNGLSNEDVQELRDTLRAAAS